MPSPAMQDVLDLLADQRRAGADHPPSLDGLRATFAPGGRPHLIPDDVVVTEVVAGGLPAHWLDAPGSAPDRVLLFLHGGGFQFGSLHSDGELGADPTTPLASPLFAALGGLPPLLVQAGTADVLLSDSERLAAKATAAGVEVELHIGAGLPHVYPSTLGTPEAAEATAQLATFLRERVG